jgi:hypothetical protein
MTETDPAARHMARAADIAAHDKVAMCGRIFGNNAPR